MMLILPLDSPLCTLSTTGGKGYNLSILSRRAASDADKNNNNQIIVPPGFVITTEAYHDFVNQNDQQLAKEIETVLSCIHDGCDQDLEEISTTIRDAFNKRQLSKELQSEIANQLSNISTKYNENEKQQYEYYAVRSSATCEDMPDASFAGQHDTYLNVSSSSIDNLCKHIVNCFSSLYTPRAISYRQRNGIIDNNENKIGMAVVVQAMVPHQSNSGVLFTSNPLTGRRNEYVVEAIPGLGEALVSGLTDPDKYIVSVQRKTNVYNDYGTTKIRIKNKRIGNKCKTIRSVDGGGVKEETVETTDNNTTTTPADTAVLTNNDVKRIVQIGIQIQDLFGGKPQDVEWAQSSIDGKIYVVQSRPITTLFPLPNAGEEDSLQVYFSFNAGEIVLMRFKLGGSVTHMFCKSLNHSFVLLSTTVQGIVAPIYPAGQDAIRKGLLGGLLRYLTWGKHGNEGTFIQTVAERLYINVTNILRNRIGRLWLCNFLPAVEPGIMVAFDQLLDVPDLDINSGISFLFLLRVLSLAWIVVPRIICSMLFPNWSRIRLVRRVNEFVDNVQEKVEACNDLYDLVILERDAFGAFFPLLIPHLMPRMAAAFMPLGLLTKLASSLPNGKDLVLTVTRGLPHNCTTEMDLKLWQVAKTIQRDTESLRHFNSNDADTLANEYLRGNLPRVAQQAVCQFMKEYGMRGLYEIDFGRPRWREEPSALMNSIKSYVQIDEEHAPDKVFAAGGVASQDAIQQLGEQLGKPWLVSFLAKRTRALAGIRELPKFTIIRTMGHIRAKMLIEGERLVEKGVIDDARSILFVHG